VIVWRFSQHTTLDGRGGLLASARWHTRGREILYCAPNSATALLEVLVHGAVRDPQAFGNFLFVKIELPDDVPMQQVDEGELPPEWILRRDLTRARGDRWLREGAGAVLRVPSVLVPETYNLLINPQHAAAARITMLRAFPYPLDSRLFQPAP